MPDNLTEEQRTATAAGNHKTETCTEKKDYALCRDRGMSDESVAHSADSAGVQFSLQTRKN